MAKSNRGRDVSITRSDLPLTTTRLMGVTPLGISFAATPVLLPAPVGPANVKRLADVTPLHATPANRVAKNAPRNDNLYRPTPVSKDVKVCKNRSIRKQVLFASGKGGRNGMRSARYTRNSKVKC